MKVFNAPTSKDVVEFIPHTEEAPMKAYLAMNLPYPPYQLLLKDVEASEGLSLKNRGEAHITVISPVEYDQILKKHLSIAEIHKVATDFNIQKATFKPVCVGRGEKDLEGKPEKTYFVVVKGDDLIHLRGLVQAAYVKNGGQAQDFDPAKFTPHVTLGYTARDLHVEDGIRKDSGSCIIGFHDHAM
jgi:2'-5' RNA ligase